MLSWFLAVSLLPLGDFTAIGFSARADRGFGGESGPEGAARLRPAARHPGGLAGALVIVRPGPVGISAGAAAALLSALMIALSRVTTRLLAKTEPPSALLFYVLLFTTPFVGVAAAFTWTLPSGRALLLAGLAAAAGTTGQYFVARTYRHADVAALAPLEFLQIPIAAAIGFAAFGQEPDAQSALGAGIVVCAVLYTIRRERLRRRAATAAGTTPPGGSSPR
jgi:drug/metabolite transporter (DMT)-like permease